MRVEGGAWGMDGGRTFLPTRSQIYSDPVSHVRVLSMRPSLHQSFPNLTSLDGNCCSNVSAFLPLVDPKDLIILIQWLNCSSWFSAPPPPPAAASVEILEAASITMIGGMSANLAGKWCSWYLKGARGCNVLISLVLSSRSATIAWLPFPAAFCLAVVNDPSIATTDGSSQEENGKKFLRCHTVLACLSGKSVRLSFFLSVSVSLHLFLSLV